MPAPINLKGFCESVLRAIGNNIQQTDDEQIDQLADIIVRTGAKDGQV